VAGTLFLSGFFDKKAAVEAEAELEKTEKAAKETKEGAEGAGKGPVKPERAMKKSRNWSGSSTATSRWKRSF
jgi:hypothetical protein